MVAKNRAATSSAAEAQLVGCPLPACVVDFTESIRNRVAMFFSAGMDVVLMSGTVSVSPDVRGRRPHGEEVMRRVDALPPREGRDRP